MAQNKGKLSRIVVFYELNNAGFSCHGSLRKELLDAYRFTVCRK
ncbi:MAG TPA: hypothetical protein VGZ90_17690 [Puia sp.]|nr:hypothetical protein [Puia sp.]